MKVLIVDDVGYSRHYHSRLVQKFGYDSVIAESGSQALKMLERDHSIDIVLTDLMMREMDGVELYKASQRISRMTDGGSAHAPAFLLMTALRPGVDSQQRDIDKLRVAKDLGFIAVLHKPIDSDSLKSTLETIAFARGAQAVDTSSAVKRLDEVIQQVCRGQDVEILDSLLKEVNEMLDQLESAKAKLSVKS